MAMKCVLALLLVTLGNAFRSERTQLESDAMGHTMMDQGTHNSVINQLSAYNTVLTDKVAALQEALKESKEKEAEMENWLAEAGKETDTEQDSAAEEETGGENGDDKVSSLVDVEDEAATGPPNPLLAKTPQQMIAYKRSVCGRKWPKTCASERSAATHATDGFLCGHHGERIADMTIYKLTYKFLDAGPNEPNFANHARCHKGRCEKVLRKLAHTPIKKISQIGALICQWALAAPRNILIDVDGEKMNVEAEVIPPKAGKAVEDISLKLNIPIAAVTFQTANGPGTGTSFLHEAIATKAIMDALKAVGAVESALHGKVCGHGFTSGSLAAIRNDQAGFQALVMGRAATVAKVAMAKSGNSNINEKQAVAHLVHVNTPSAGIIIKLNGAHSEACVAADWAGAPL